MKLILLLIAATGWVQSACISISSERIRVSDLVESLPELRSLAPDTVIGFTPLPGTERVVHGRELSLIASRQGIEIGGFSDVCVQRQVHPISEDQLRAALLKVLDIPDLQLEIVDFSRQPLPSGTLEFERSALGRPPARTPDIPVIWRGKLVYDQRHSAAIWAKVKLEVERRVFVAAEDIAAGRAIGESQVKPLTAREFPLLSAAFDSAGQIVGKIARRSLSEGQRFEPSLIEEPKTILRGDIVQVRVIDGLATLSLEGIAESSGNTGDTVLIHNSRSGRNFKAVVEEKGKALVLPGPVDSHETAN